MEDFALTWIELLFLIGAVLVTLPIIYFGRYILRELKLEPKKADQNPS